MIKLYSFILLFIANSILLGQSPNRPIPLNDGHPFEFINYNTSKNGYYVIAPFRLPRAPFSASDLYTNAYILDSKGYIYWYLKLTQIIAIDFKYHPDNHVFSFNSFNMGPGGITYFVELNEQLEMNDSTNPVGITFDNHEYLRLKNGNYLLSARKDSLMDLTGYTFGSVPGTNNMVTLGYVIQELDSNKNLLFEWNSNDHVHPTEMNDEFADLYADSASFDYAHGNSIDKDSNGNYYISLRHTNCVYKIDSNGNIVWRLGGKLSDFTFANDSGFSGQHDARVLPNGNISLFDNTNTSTIKISRGVEYQLDTTTWTATRVRELNYTDSVYANAMGGYYTSETKERILNYGFVYRPSPSMLHYDSNFNLVSELYFRDSVMSYRGFYFENNLMSFLPPQPVVNCYDTTVLAKKLVAPSGYNKYKWSTGDTTQTILVYQSGEYQVWMNYGDGMLGSKPIVVDINSSCNSVGVSEINRSSDKIIAIYNILGKKIEKAIPNQVNIYQYESGQVKKVIPVIE